MFIKKKIILIGSAFGFCGMGLLILVASLFCFDFFGSNVVDDYVENNSEYADRYLKTINNHIKKGDGYVSLSRIIYFYNANPKLTFEEIYNDNLDTELKQVKPISDVCKLSKYSYLYVCKDSELSKSNQIDDIQLKPLIPPLNTSNMNATSFFMQERIIYGESNIHNAWDFSSPALTLVYASCNGTVTKVSFTYKTNSINTEDTAGGNHIKITCDENNEAVYNLYYAHLYPYSNKVKTGDRVVAGEQIAGVGTTGYSTGNHLHFQVSDKDGKLVDGLSLIDFNSKVLYTIPK